MYYDVESCLSLKIYTFDKNSSVIKRNIIVLPECKVVVNSPQVADVKILVITV
jgi:hypothetical protein